MTTDIEILRQAIKTFSGMNDADFDLSLPYWQPKEYKKGEFYNEYRSVCKYLGFVMEGVFRTYFVEEDSGTEKNILFYSRNQVLVAFKSFLTQTPCNYYTQSMSDSRIVYIHIHDLQKLYETSHAWERMGRILAEMAFNLAMSRTESFLFRTHEQRYIDLMEQHPDIFNTIPLYHISSYLGIEGPSLSRIRKRISEK